MDEATILEDFDKLESRLDKLVSACETLRAENAELKERALSLQSQLEEKVVEESRRIQERALVRARIDSLLNRIVEAEKAAEAV